VNFSTSECFLACITIPVFYIIIACAFFPSLVVKRRVQAYTLTLKTRPTSIFSLTCDCTLLLSGSVADVVGSRVMYLVGSFLQSIFTLACGLSRTSSQLILFCGLAGIANSLCLPSAVSIITNSFPEGKHRNIAFASMGGAQPIGFSIGLTLGGVFAGTIGWRWGFHIAAILNTIVFVLAVWGLPQMDDNQATVSWSRIRTDIDWVGATIASISLAVLSYVLA
jgi:MFS family permease